MPLFRKKEVPKISPERLYKSILTINPNIKYDDDSQGNIVISVTIPSDTGQATRTAKIRLDTIGSRIWRKIDGKTSIVEIIQWMKNEFKITAREAEESLLIFINSLIEKRLVALILPSPRPGTPEVQEEIQRIKAEKDELEKAYRKKKVDKKIYEGLKEKYEEAIEELKKLEKPDGKPRDEA